MVVVAEPPGPGGNAALAAAALFTEGVGRTICYYINGQFAPRKAVFLPDFDHHNVGLLARSSRLNDFLVVQSKALVRRPDFDPGDFARGFPTLPQELDRQAGGPKITLANIPRRT